MNIKLESQKDGSSQKRWRKKGGISIKSVLKGYEKRLVWCWVWKKHKHKSRQKHPLCTWHRRAESEKDLGEEDGKIPCNTAD